MSEDKEQKPKWQRDSWFDDVYIDSYGWCWAMERIDKDDGYYELMPFCLGKEAEILPILKGDKTIPEDITPRQRAVLIRMRIDAQTENKGKENERTTKPTAGTTGLQRGRLIKSPRHIKRGIRHA